MHVTATAKHTFLAVACFPQELFISARNRDCKPAIGRPKKHFGIEIA